MHPILRLPRISVILQEKVIKYGARQNMASGIAYRERATECLRIGEGIIDERMKTVWAKLAAEWIVLAEQIERENLKLDQMPNK